MRSGTGDSADSEFPADTSPPLSSVTEGGILFIFGRFAHLFCLKSLCINVDTVGYRSAYREEKSGLSIDRKALDLGSWKNDAKFEADVGAEAFPRQNFSNFDLRTKNRGCNWRDIIDAIHSKLKSKTKHRCRAEQVLRFSRAHLAITSALKRCSSQNQYFKAFGIFSTEAIIKKKAELAYCRSHWALSKNDIAFCLEQNRGTYD